MDLMWIAVAVMCLILLYLCLFAPNTCANGNGDD
jgi:hypothetical protein